MHGVVPGQAGEVAGLEAGDQVVAINGVAWSEIDQSELAGVFGSPEPVALSVDRAGQRLEIELVTREQ